MKPSFKKLPPVIFCLLLTIYLLADAKAAAECVKNAVTMCLNRLLPSLFPFFVLSSLLCSTGLSEALSRLLTKPFRHFFGVSGSGALPLILGFLGGYPTGVKTVCTMYQSGNISKDEAQRLLLFTGNTGPAFIIGAAGIGIFASPKAGFLLYGFHILSAILMGIFCRIIFGAVPKNDAKMPQSATDSFASAFTSSVTGALYTCLNVTAFVMIFSVLSGLLTFFGVTETLCAAAEGLGANPIYVKALITGFLEIASGIDSLSALARDIRFAMPAAAFILAWGSISVHCQALSAIVPANLRAGGYVIAKLCHGTLSAIFTYIAVVFGACEAVFSFTGHVTTKSFIFDYLGLFFSVGCGFASLFLYLIARHRRRKNVR